MKSTRIEFLNGIKGGLPIALGYIPVSFSFGMICVQSGIPVWAAVAISMTNLTSAGQFAGMNLIALSAPLTEIGLTTLIINLRYMLMSLVLSQKIEKMSFMKRMLCAFGITDEIFTVASTRVGAVGFPYLLGLIMLPYLGWAAGTVLGAVANGLLPASISSCMGIALYAMFIAIVVPAAKKDKCVLITILFAVCVSCILKYMPFLRNISSGWSIIITTLLASAFGAFIFPRSEEESKL